MAIYKITLSLAGKVILEEEANADNADLAIDMAYNYLYDVLKAEAVEVNRTEDKDGQLERG